MKKRAGRRRPVILAMLYFLAVMVAFQTRTQQTARGLTGDLALESDDFFPGDYSNQGVIGRSLPGTWRPFSDASPWNRRIPESPKIHLDSGTIMALVVSQAQHIRLARLYAIPIWVVNSDNVPLVKVRGEKIFDTWDRDHDGWSDVGAPITQAMWGEPTGDGHLCVIDPFKKLTWELSRFGRMMDGTPTCSTFNIWDLTQAGVGDSNEGVRWRVRGGRGSGFPEIAGLLRPEELAAGAIRHALVFSFPMNRRADNGDQIFIPPACRSDGKYIGSQYPIEGMRFQLDPSLSEKDFNAWGLSREGKIVARALQEYGMLNGDNGGAMALQVQLLGPTAAENYVEWEARYPGFYKNMEKIPTAKFRVIFTADPIVKK